MTVAFDAFSEVAAGTGTLTWDHDPVGTPRAVIVMVVQDDGTTDSVTTVTYDGTSMVEVTGSPLLKSSGEPGGVHIFFLGASVPTTDPAEIVVSRNGTITARAAAITLTAADDTEVVDTSTLSSDSQANPSLTVSLAGRTSFVAEAFFSGRGAITQLTPLTFWTDQLEHDFGATTAGWYTFDTVGSTDVTAGYSAGGDDVVLIALAVSEVEAEPSGTGTQTLGTFAQAGVGVMQPSGAGAQILETLAQAGVGVEKFTATGAQILGILAQAGVGVMQPSGVGAQILGILAQDGVGAEIFTATGAQILGILAQAGIGVAGAPEGTGAQILGILAQASVGVMQPSGAGAQILGILAQAGVGVEIFTATGAQILSTLAQAGVGTFKFSGAGTQRLGGLTQVATGIILLQGTGIQTLLFISQNGAGVGLIPGFGAQILGTLAQAGVGTQVIPGLLFVAKFISLIGASDVVLTHKN